MFCVASKAYTRLLRLKTPDRNSKLIDLKLQKEPVNSECFITTLLANPVFLTARVFFFVFSFSLGSADV